MATNDAADPFDPLAVENIGVTLAVELLEQPVHPLPPEKRFPGAGVYALYYVGDHSAYRELVRYDGRKLKYPVYVGKAVRENVKQGFNPRPTSQAKLYERIRDHSKSVDAARNLDLRDFKCRYLVLNDAYIGLAESVMIMVFRPPWNGMGLGSNVVGKYREGGTPSLWDAMHGGRAGRPSESEEQEKKGRAKIEESIAKLREPSTDPRVRRMLEKIKKFV